jgi:peptidoglycan/LPS O-acetylase OafA/YrhL
VAAVTPAEPRAAAAPSPAVAPPPGNPRFPLVDSLRAIAVLAVVTFHVTSITGDVNKHIIGDVFAVLGNQGLVLFFAISGFLLYRPFVAARVAGRKRPSLARYARRRVLRIVPAYWTALTLLAIFPGIVGVFSGDWWRYYFFLQLYSNRTLGRGIPVAWTLCVEVSFYLALPLWATFVSRLRPTRDPRAWFRAELGALALLAAFGIVVQLAASRQTVSQLVANSLLGECTWFALGMALAVVTVKTQSCQRRSWAMRIVVERPGLCWIGAAGCLAGLAAVLHPGGLLNIVLTLSTKQPLARTLAGIALTAGLIGLLMAPAVLGGEAADRLPRRVLRARVLAWLGLISYGIYLWHLTIAELLGNADDTQHFSASGLGLVASVHHATTPILMFLTIAVAVAVASASYYLVELPFLRRKEA